MARRGGFPGGMPGNMNNLMKQAQKMQRQMEEAQKQLEDAEALRQIDEQSQASMSKITGGLGGGLF